MLGYSIIVFVAGLMLLITSAVSMQRSTECNQYKEASNDSWLLIALMTSLLMIGGSGVGFFLWFKKRGGPEAILQALKKVAPSTPL